MPPSWTTKRENNEGRLPTDANRGRFLSSETQAPLGHPFWMAFQQTTEYGVLYGDSQAEAPGLGPPAQYVASPCCPHSAVPSGLQPYNIAPLPPYHTFPPHYMNPFRCGSSLNECRGRPNVNGWMVDNPGNYSAVDNCLCLEHDGRRDRGRKRRGEQITNASERQYHETTHRNQQASVSEVSPSCARSYTGSLSQKSFSPGRGKKLRARELAFPSSSTTVDKSLLHDKCKKKHSQQTHSPKSLLHKARSRNGLDTSAKAQKPHFASLSRDQAINLSGDFFISQLRAFRDTYGHCRVPKEYSVRLHLWVQRQRRKARECKMNLEREEILEELGFDWSEDTPSREELTIDDTKSHRPSHEATAKDESGEIPRPRDNRSMRVRMKQLKEFKARHGHCRVPFLYPSGLGEWVENQRKEHRSGTMSVELEEFLEELGFSWLGSGLAT